MQNELEIKKNEINEFRNTPSKTQEDRCQDYKQQIANLGTAFKIVDLRIDFFLFRKGTDCKKTRDK